MWFFTKLTYRRVDGIASGFRLHLWREGGAQAFSIGSFHDPGCLC